MSTLLTVLFDVTRETSTPVEPDTFSPQPTPDALALLALGARGGLRTLVALGTRGVGLALPRASRLGFSSRMYNLLVTNVPGPQVPICMLGRELLELTPLAFLAPEHTLAIAIISYHGGVTYGLLADAAAVPDLPVLADTLSEALAELVASARAIPG